MSFPFRIELFDADNQRLGTCSDVRYGGIGTDGAVRFVGSAPIKGIVTHMILTCDGAFIARTNAAELVPVNGIATVSMPVLFNNPKKWKAPA